MVAKRQRSATIGDVQLQPATGIKADLPEMSLTEITESYEKLLLEVEDPAVQAELKQRIAVLKVMQGEQSQLDGEANNDAYYGGAITALTGFINDNPGAEGNDKLLYQLAKAYDLQGDSANTLKTIERLINEFPENPYLLEVHFRRAEILFSDQQYAKALSSYQVVTATEDDNPYYAIALYMQGWSYFKLEQYQQALITFSKIFDSAMPDDVMTDVHTLEELSAALPSRDKQLVEETFTVMTLIFSATEGVDSLTRHYMNIGERPYEHLNYAELADYYLSKQRYSDAIGVYSRYIETHQDDEMAVIFAMDKMTAMRRGRFVTELKDEKVAFVDTYKFAEGTQETPYWQGKDGLVREKTTPVLMALTQELAQNAHANAQQQKRLLASNNTNAQRTKVNTAYGETARYYQMFLASFPEHIGASTMSFYLAESYYEMGDYDQAAQYYETVAYAGNGSTNANTSTTDSELDPELVAEFNKDYSAEAAYALILTYDKRIESAQTEEQKQRLTDEQSDYKAQFIASYPSDSRAASVQSDVFQQYFKSGDHENAIEFATAALASPENLSAEQRLSALLVIAHSQYAEEDYAAAEQSYKTILASLDKNDRRYKDMNDRYAASIYRQGEIAANSDPADLDLATKHFARVIELAPDSKVRINAQYDLGSHLLTQKKYKQAINQFSDFRTRYPNNELSKDIPTKLAFAFQETGQWEQAANYLKMTWSANPKSQDTRQMLWLSAETYMKAGNKNQAMRAYRSYAHTYPVPYSTSLEAKFIMSEFYNKDSEQSLTKEGDEYKRKFWLKKIVEADNKAVGAERTDRSRYLAAMSQLVFADEKMIAFRRAKLTLPLNQSLAKKRELLNTTLEAYNQVVGYQVAEFATTANYRIGEVYRQLGKDLLASERPQDLDALELEQYEILLEEQSFPFEDQAIAVHETNAKRTQDGVYDAWVQRSFAALAELMPGRYNKQEQIVENVNEVY